VPHEPERRRSAIVCHFDGSCPSIGGIASYGFTVSTEGALIHEEAGLYEPVAEERTSNNLAEYYALLKLLEWLEMQGWQDRQLEIRGDSQLVIQQMWGKRKIKRGVYVHLARKAKNLVQHFPRSTGCWIPRELNTLADGLARTVR
jgi:ribonuclease HI